MTDQRSPLQKNLDALFHKGEPETAPSLFVVNRFLAWEPAYAPYAAAVSRIREDGMAWAVWRTALPRRARAPYLGYPAPKRAPDAEALVEALMARTHLSRVAAEEAVDVLSSAQVKEAARAYGVDS